MTDAAPTIVTRSGRPVSSCCQAEVECRKDYLDTNVYVVQDVEVRDGKVVAATYRYVKTYDGIDGTNMQVVCRGCEKELDTESIELDEG